MNVQWHHTKSTLLSLEKQIKCIICGNLPNDPHLLWCKHTFCKECILKLPKCPQCNYPVKAQEVVRNIMLDRLLNAIKLSSEIVNSSTTANDKDLLEKKVEKNLHVINETVDKVKKTNSEQSLVVHSHLKSSELKVKSRKSNDNPTARENIDICKENRIKSNQSNRSMKTLIKKGNDQGKVEQRVEPLASTPKQRDRRTSSLSSRKGTIQESKKPTSKNASDVESSIKSKPDSLKTPKSNSALTAESKSKLSNCFSPKSPILFSAKKIHSSSKVNVKGETPLQIACRQGKLDLVKKLLEEGAEPNVKDYANWTPLCDAVGSGNVEVVRLLLEAGAGVNTPSNQNTTALVEAVARGDKTMVRLLMSYGADLHQRTALNNTALSIADDEMKTMLLSFSDTTAQPYPRVKSSPRAILADKLSHQNIDQLMALCQKYNLSLSTIILEDISHIVVDKTEDNLCHGSVAVMMGILSGCSVVGTDWVTACLAGNELLPPEDYEPAGTDDYPHTNVFLRARLNREHLLPRLFDGCHISLQHDQSWPDNHKQDVIALIQVSGAVYQPRQCDAERIPPSEQTVMFHAPRSSPLELVSHIILYQPGPAEPLLKYNMAHVKSLPVSWFVQCIKNFALV